MSKVSFDILLDSFFFHRRLRTTYRYDKELQESNATATKKLQA